MAFQAGVLAIEARILQAVGFDTHVALRHRLAVTYLHALDFLLFPRKPWSQRGLEYFSTGLGSWSAAFLSTKDWRLSAGDTKDRDWSWRHQRQRLELETPKTDWRLSL